MKINTSYSCKIKYYNHIFKETVALYRKAVDFFIGVCLNEWDDVTTIKGTKALQRYIETLCIISGKSQTLKYDFDTRFYKFPCYLRRAAISEAIGKVSSYKSNLDNWEAEDPKIRGKAPGIPKAGYIYPVLYKDNMYELTNSPYQMRVKVFIRNTWDWITVNLKKSDVDYVLRHCKARKQMSPTLQKRGKQWYLDFPFEEDIKLNKTKIQDQTIAAVDLGLNSAATVSIMRSDGTVLGRHFLKLPKEYDCLKHSINRIKKAQQRGARRMPRLWARAKGINNDIAVNTATFIHNTAVLYDADVIVFEHLDLGGKKKGSKKQRLHHWRAQYVQAMVSDKAHRDGIRISTICAWGTSRLAFDGSGKVLRGKEAELGSYSVCKFNSGKVYNCDLNATYNIGSRYFIRELLKSLPVKARLAAEAKVPQLAKRSTCTLSTLISLNAVLAESSAGKLSSVPYGRKVVPAA